MKQTRPAVDSAAHLRKPRLLAIACAVSVMLAHGPVLAAGPDCDSQDEPEAGNGGEGQKAMAGSGLISHAPLPSIQELHSGTVTVSDLIELFDVFADGQLASNAPDDSAVGSEGGDEGDGGGKPRRCGGNGWRWQGWKAP